MPLVILFMAIGIKRIFLLQADKVINNDATLSSVISSPIAAGQTQLIRAWMPINCVSGTGGYKSQILTPAGAALFYITPIRYRPAATSIFSAANFPTPTASTLYSFLGATIVGLTGFEFSFICINGATAGIVDIQMAQAIAEISDLTILKGCSLEVTIL